MPKLHPIFVHCQQNDGMMARFDTLLMPNATIACLCGTALRLMEKYPDRLAPPLAIDEGFLGSVPDHPYFSEPLEKLLATAIDDALAAGDKPVVFFTVLAYNAWRTSSVIESLGIFYGTGCYEKSWDELSMGVGGQLVPNCPISDDDERTRYWHPEFLFRHQSECLLDHVGVGDAEEILEPLLIGRQSFAQQVTETRSYDPPVYDYYWGLAERFNAAKEFRLGPFTDIRQLLVESVRGCAWAYANKQACEMCALWQVDQRPGFKSFDEHCRIERELVEKWGINWIFDVSNQWLPTIQPAAAVRWLTDYIAARKHYGAPDLHRYVYLTTNSITPQTAPLLREAGVRVAYIGIDGWTTDVQRSLHKTIAGPERLRKVLRLCRENDIYVRTSLVIGTGLTSKNIRELPLFVEHLLGEFHDVILSFGNFLEYVIPGAENWRQFREMARTREGAILIEADNMFWKFDHYLALTWKEQERLNELRIRHLNPTVSYEEIVAARDQAMRVAGQYEAISYNLTSTFSQKDSL